MLEWGGLDPGNLQAFPGETARYGNQTWPFRIADIWLHSAPPGESAVGMSEIPYCLETHPGILVVSERERKQRLPVLGMRALAWNRATLRLAFDGPMKGYLSLGVP